MKEDSTGNAPLIELDPRELLGLSKVAKVSGVHRATGRLLNKVGEGPGQPSRLAKLLSKSKVGGKGPTPPGFGRKRRARQPSLAARGLRRTTSEVLLQKYSARRNPAL